MNQICNFFTKLYSPCAKAIWLVYKGYKIIGNTLLYPAHPSVPPPGTGIGSSMLPVLNSYWLGCFHLAVRDSCLRVAEWVAGGCPAPFGL